MFLLKVRKKNGCKHFLLRAREGQKMFNNFHSFFLKDNVDIGLGLRDLGQKKDNERKELQKKWLMGRKKNCIFSLFMIKFIFAQSKSQFSSYMHVGKKILICKAHPKYITNFKQNL